VSYSQRPCINGFQRYVGGVAVENGFNEGRYGWTSVPMDQFVRDVAWKVPPAPPYYNASEAITGQQLALLLRDTHSLAL